MMTPKKEEKKTSILCSGKTEIRSLPSTPEAGAG